MQRKYEENYQYYLNLIKGKTESGNELTYIEFVQEHGVQSEVLKYHGIEYYFGDKKHKVIKEKL